MCICSWQWGKIPFIHSFKNIENLLSACLCSGFQEDINNQNTLSMGESYHFLSKLGYSGGEGRIINNYFGKTSMTQSCLKQTRMYGHPNLKIRRCMKSELYSCSDYPWIVFPLSTQTHGWKSNSLSPKAYLWRHPPRHQLWSLLRASLWERWTHT